MANNPLLYNAALAAAVGAAKTSRWITSQQSNSYVNDRNAAVLFAAAVDSAIVADPSAGFANAELIFGICGAVLQLKAFTESQPVGNIALAVAALYYELTPVLEAESIPGVSVAFTSRGTGATLRDLFTRDQDVVWVSDFMTAAEQDDAYNCTLTLDMQPAIQAAIDYALYKDQFANVTGGPRVRLPGGMLRIDRTIQLGYGLDFRSILFEGEGIRYGGNDGTQGSGTSLHANFNDAPAIAVQGGFATRISGMSIWGLNTDWIVTTIIGAPTMADLGVSHWVDPTFPASASSRYAPYVAIAIDPYSGPEPAVHYPAVNYPAFLGVVPQYNKLFSSKTTIENVFIRGFVVGVAQQACDADGNGDFTAILNSLINFCAYAVVWGNTQSRVLTLRQLDLNVIHTGFDTVTFGRQSGEPQMACNDCSFGAMIQIVNIPNLNFGQGPAFYHCFGENLYKLGRLGQSAETAGSVLFDNCQFGFGWWGIYGIPVYVLDVQSLCLVTFRDVFFYCTGVADNYGSLAFNSFFFGGSSESGRLFAFEGCSLFVGTAPTQLWQKCALNATVGFSFRDLHTALSNYRGMRLQKRFDLDTGADLSAALFDETNFGSRATCLPVFGSKAKGLLFGGDPGINNLWQSAGVFADAAVTQAGRNISFVSSGVSTDSLAQSGGDVGDILQAGSSRAVFWVYSRVGTTISARAMTGFDSAGNLLSVLPNGEAFSSLSCRRYCPGPNAVVYGNITAGSPVVTNLILGDANAANLPNLFTVGDHWYVDTGYDKIIESTDSRITAIDNVAKTMTFAGNFMQTRTRIRLGIFTRAAMPNGTPT